MLQCFWLAFHFIKFSITSTANNRVLVEREVVVITIYSSSKPLGSQHDSGHRCFALPSRQICCETSNLKFSPTGLRYSGTTISSWPGYLAELSICQVTGLLEIKEQFPATPCNCNPALNKPICRACMCSRSGHRYHWFVLKVNTNRIVNAQLAKL